MKNPDITKADEAKAKAEAEAKAKAEAEVKAGPQFSRASLDSMGLDAACYGYVKE